LITCWIMYIAERFRNTPRKYVVNKLLPYIFSTLFCSSWTISVMLSSRPPTLTTVPIQGSMLKKNKSGRLLVVLVTIVIGDSPAVRLKMIPTVTNEAHCRRVADDDCYQHHEKSAAFVLL